MRNTSGHYDTLLRTIRGILKRKRETKTNMGRRSKTGSKRYDQPKGGAARRVSFHFGAFCFDVRQFGAFQFGAFHFDAVPVRRVSLWRSSTSARFTLARFHFGAFHFGAFPNFVRTYGDPVPANASSVSRGQFVCMFPFRVSQFFFI